MLEQAQDKHEIIERVAALDAQSASKNTCAKGTSRARTPKKMASPAGIGARSHCKPACTIATIAKG